MEEEEGAEGPFSFKLHDVLVPGLVAVIVALLVSLATVLVVKGGQDNTIQSAAAAASRSGARQGSAAAILAIRKTQVPGCERTQIARGLDRFQLGSAASLAPDLKKVNDLTRGYEQILDCVATVANNGNAVALPAQLQRCFVSLVGAGYFIKNQVETAEAPLRSICIAEKML